MSRRVYSVESANRLWHKDTNHKLIRWKFVIAGGVDGFSRLITFLRCLDNNRAPTLLECFKQSIVRYGLPTRVRSDKGMENTLIADYMIQQRGIGRRSMITGKSVHNQRIERLWRDVFAGVLSYYYNLFHHMEDIGLLNPLDEHHLFALHNVFMNKINEKLEIWKNAWDNHRIRTVHRSPMQMFTASVMNETVQVEQIHNYTTNDNDVPGETIDGVNLLGLDIQLNLMSMVQLNENCPKNWISEDYGIDIYRQAVEILQHQ